jgi:hypothetical protein
MLATALCAATVAVVPASAQTVHFVGAGSSAQFTMSAIAADQAAINANNDLYSGANTVQHWSKKNAASVSDNRDKLNRILPEVGNIWVVWLQNGGGTVTDVWTDLSVDSTVGVRVFSIQEKIGTSQVSGGQLQISSTAGTVSDNLIGSASLWPDNTADVPVVAGVLSAINTTVSGGVHINVGLTDIRPEDALFATTRSLAALNTTTYAGLGYTGVTANIGAPINTAQGTGTAATPIKFALAGKNDPINTTFPVPAYTTIPIGAAPIVFIYNNDGNSAYPIDVKSGVTPGVHVAGQTYPLANLFDGTSAAGCVTTNPAFDSFFGGTPATQNLTVFLREPLSGTMNTTEFSLFRSFGNTSDSQEVGVINPTRSPYNPLDLTCANGGGARERSIGTGEVVGKLGTGGIGGTGGYGVLNNANSIGYIFWGFSNAGKFWASGAVGADYNYLTLDGVDPLGLPATLTGNGAQNLPNCTTATCPASQWAGSNSFPNLRNGTYKAWSIYRWVTVSNSDPYGPAEVAQLAQNYVDQDVADFVPFTACALSDPNCSSSAPTDGLSVYHSHFTQSGISCTVTSTCNGSATTANTFNSENTLGGGPEAGGDEGGLIEGPFNYTFAPVTGDVTTTGTTNNVTWHSGTKFTVGAAWVGSTIVIGGTNFTITTPNPTATVLHVTVNPPKHATPGVAYSVTYTSPLATSPGVVTKKQ